MLHVGRRQTLALAAGTAAFGLAPGRASALPAKPAPLATRVKLTLGVNTVPHAAPLQTIADALRPLGVDVEAVKFERYADIRTALASGSIDVGTIGPADVPIAVSQGIKSIVALMGLGISPKNPIVKTGVTVEKWDDLIGKRVGVAPGSAVWFQFAATLTEAGVPYNKLNVLNMQGAGTAMVQAMQRGDIDVFVCWEPFESMAVAQGIATRDTRLDYSTSKAVGAELGLMGANRSYIDAHRDAMQRFIWAYLDIQAQLMQSKAALAQGVAAFTGLSLPIATNIAGTLQLGQFLTLDQMQRQAAEFYKLGVLTKDVSADLPHYFDVALVESVTRA